MREATGAPAPKRRSRLRGKLRNLFEQRCADSGFSPTVAAQELGISVRTLHAWLALDGCRFGAELLERRLERARMMLGSGTSDRTIQEVAAMCGFVSAAHLSRRFRERYGVSPSQWRARGDLRPASPPAAALRPVFLPVATANGRGTPDLSALPA
jgi:AraC-like DNA-binding protein